VLARLIEAPVAGATGDDRGEHHEIDSHAGESGAGLAVDHAEDGEHEDERTHELSGERLSRAHRIAARGDAETDVASTTSTGPSGPTGPCAASTSRSPRPRTPSPARRRSSATGSPRLSGGTRTVNRALEAKARALAGLKGYVTNLAACPDGTPVTAEFVIDAYHRLFHIEKSFRMSKHDLQARPIYHHQRDSIEAHLTIVFAALAVSRWIEDRTGWSIKKFVRTARRYRTIEIQAGAHTITAADPLSDDLRQALDRINRRPGAH